MAYVLEYVTGRSVGRAAIDCANFPDTLAKARNVLKGLDCVKAVLRSAPAASYVYGEGVVLASFTTVDGWTSEQAGGEATADP